MLLMGDEIRRTPKGNNNSYCQDNELRWFDWMLVKKEQRPPRPYFKYDRFTLELELFKLKKILDTTGSILEPSIRWQGVNLGCLTG